MKRNLYILLTLFAVLLAGCEHKDFCCRCLQADDVEVVFDWSRSPYAAPASMKVYFFPEGGGEALVYEFADIHGGSIRLPAGNYRAVCVNSDTEFLHYEHTDRFDSIRACTGGGVSGQLPGTDGEEFRNAPTGYGPTGSRHSPSGTARTSGVSSSAPLPRSAGTPWRYAMSPTSVTSAVRVASAVR